MCKISGCNITTSNTHDYVVSASLKFYDEENEEFFHTVVISIIDNNNFTKNEIRSVTSLFLSAKQISDFNILDKNSIYTVVISAIQE